MLAYVLYAVLAQAVPQADEHALVRTLLIDHYREADTLIREFEESVDRMAQSPRPNLGVRLETMEQGGQPPRRATMVVSVFPESAAAKAGIREGDRLVAIGNEELDHESGKAVMLYLSNYPDAVPLVVEREGTRTSMTLRWEAIPCLVRANREFRSAVWKERFGRLRRTLAEQAMHLPTLTTAEGLELALDNLQKGSALGQKMITEMAVERGLAMAKACASPKQ